MYKKKDQRDVWRCFCGLNHYVMVSLLAMSAGCSDSPRKGRAERVINPALVEVSAVPAAEAASCAACHPKQVEEWMNSQHAHANRLVSTDLDAPAFAGMPGVHGEDFTTTMVHDDNRFQFHYAVSNQPPDIYTAEAVIGITPLRQYLVSAPGGRLQVTDMAFDPRSNEWFNVFPDGRREGEWGHWTGRGMTWNVQCAFCHTTGFEKNYDPAKDTYSSTWKAMGVSCSQCHTTREQISGVGHPVSVETNECPMVFPVHSAFPETRHPTPDTPAVMDNCASCHARREELFGTFKPGDAFHDHYRLTLPDQPGIFHADGQVLDEDFEYASLMMSRMGHKGVTCLDCHNPHSGKLVAPVENNALCMKCHIPPGLNGATPIDPVAHSFHKPGTPGSRCVDCHMQENYYMVRDPRRDHGFTSPDPRLTIEFGIPNACNRCHTDQTAEWADAITETWYGEKMNRRARDRARVIEAYHSGSPATMPGLLEMARSEEIDAWRAALVSMLSPWSSEPDTAAFLKEQVTHTSPLVRSAAVRSLAPSGATASLIPLRKDPYALVRVDATLATLSPAATAYSFDEVRDYLFNISDQPAGAHRQAVVALQEGRTNDVMHWTGKLIAWDSSAHSYYLAGRMQHVAGFIFPAVSNMAAAALMEPTSSEYSYSLALALAEGGNQEHALSWLEETVRRDPNFARGWYNLGLAYAAEERLSEAVRALQRAEQIDHTSADIPYARATIHLRLGQPSEARTAAMTALQCDPQHAPSRRILMQGPR